MLGHGELGHIALSPAERETEIGQGKEDVHIQALKTLRTFYQGTVRGCKKQWGGI